ncbi:MAG: hypothetical protein ABIG11_04995, partial [bacterium]
MSDWLEIIRNYTGGLQKLFGGSSGTLFGMGMLVTGMLIGASSHSAGESDTEAPVIECNPDFKGIPEVRLEGAIKEKLKKEVSEALGRGVQASVRFYSNEYRVIRNAIRLGFTSPEGRKKMSFMAGDCLRECLAGKREGVTFELMESVEGISDADYPYIIITLKEPYLLEHDDLEGVAVRKFYVYPTSGYLAENIPRRNLNAKSVLDFVIKGGVEVYPDVLVLKDEDAVLEFVSAVTPENDGYLELIVPEESRPALTARLREERRQAAIIYEAENRKKAAGIIQAFDPNACKDRKALEDARAKARSAIEALKLENEAGPLNELAKKFKARNDIFIAEEAAVREKENQEKAAGIVQAFDPNACKDREALEGALAKARSAIEALELEDEAGPLGELNGKCAPRDEELKLAASAAGAVQPEGAAARAAAISEAPQTGPVNLAAEKAVGRETEVTGTKLDAPAGPAPRLPVRSDLPEAAASFSADGFEELSGAIFDGPVVPETDPASHLSPVAPEIIEKALSLARKTSKCLESNVPTVKRTFPVRAEEFIKILTDEFPEDVRMAVLEKAAETIAFYDPSIKWDVGMNPLAEILPLNIKPDPEDKEENARRKRTVRRDKLYGLVAAFLYYYGTPDERGKIRNDFAVAEACSPRPVPGHPDMTEAPGLPGLMIDDSAMRKIRAIISKYAKLDGIANELAELDKGVSRHVIRETWRLNADILKDFQELPVRLQEALLELSAQVAVRYSKTNDLPFNWEGNGESLRGRLGQLQVAVEMGRDGLNPPGTNVVGISDCIQIVVEALFGSGNSRVRGYKEYNIGPAMPDAADTVPAASASAADEVVLSTPDTNEAVMLAREAMSCLNSSQKVQINIYHIKAKDFLVILRDKLPDATRSAVLEMARDTTAYYDPAITWDDPIAHLNDAISLCEKRILDRHGMDKRRTVVRGMAYAIMYYYGTEEEKMNIRKAFEEAEASRPRVIEGMTHIPGLPPIGEPAMRKIETAINAYKEADKITQEAIELQKDVRWQDNRTRWRYAGTLLNIINDLPKTQEGILEVILEVSAQIAVKRSEEKGVKYTWRGDIGTLKNKLFHLVVQTEGMLKDPAPVSSEMVAITDSLGFAFAYLFGADAERVDLRRRYDLPLRTHADTGVGKEAPIDLATQKIIDATNRLLERSDRDIIESEREKRRLNGVVAPAGTSAQYTKDVKAQHELVRKITEDAGEFARVLLEDLPSEITQKVLDESRNVRQRYLDEDNQHARIKWDGARESLEKLYKKLRAKIEHNAKTGAVIIGLDHPQYAIVLFLRNAFGLSFGDPVTKKAIARHLGIEIEDEEKNEALEDEAREKIFLEEDVEMMTREMAEQAANVIDHNDYKGPFVVWVGKIGKVYATLMQHKLHVSVGLLPDQRPGIKLAHYMREAGIIGVELAKPFNEEKTPWGLRLTFRKNLSVLEGFPEEIGQHKDMIIFIRKKPAPAETWADEAVDWSLGAFLGMQELAALAASMRPVTEAVSFEDIYAFARDERVIPSNIAYVIPDVRSLELFVSRLGGTKAQQEKRRKRLIGTPKKPAAGGGGKSAGRRYAARASGERRYISSEFRTGDAETKARRKAEEIISKFRELAASEHIDSVGLTAAYRESHRNFEPGDTRIKLPYKEEYGIILSGLYRERIVQVKAEEGKEAVKEEAARDVIEGFKAVKMSEGRGALALLDEAYAEALRRIEGLSLKKEAAFLAALEAERDRKAGEFKKAQSELAMDAFIQAAEEAAAEAENPNRDIDGLGDIRAILLEARDTTIEAIDRLGLGGDASDRVRSLYRETDDSLKNAQARCLVALSNRANEAAGTEDAEKGIAAATALDAISDICRRLETLRGDISGAGVSRVAQIRKDLAQIYEDLQEVYPARKQETDEKETAIGLFDEISREIEIRAKAIEAEMEELCRPVRSALAEVSGKIESALEVGDLSGKRKTERSAFLESVRQGLETSGTDLAGLTTRAGSAGNEDAAQILKAEITALEKRLVSAIALMEKIGDFCDYVEAFNNWPVTGDRRVVSHALVNTGTRPAQLAGAVNADRLLSEMEENLAPGNPDAQRLFEELKHIQEEVFAAKDAEYDAAVREKEQAEERRREEEAELRAGAGGFFMTTLTALGGIAMRLRSLKNGQGCTVEDLLAIEKDMPQPEPKFSRYMSEEQRDQLNQAADIIRDDLNKLWPIAVEVLFERTMQEAEEIGQAIERMEAASYARGDIIQLRTRLNEALKIDGKIWVHFSDTQRDFVRDRRSCLGGKLTGLWDSLDTAEGGAPELSEGPFIFREGDITAGESLGKDTRRTGRRDRKRGGKGEAPAEDEACDASVAAERESVVVDTGFIRDVVARINLPTEGQHGTLTDCVVRALEVRFRGDQRAEDKALTEALGILAKGNVTGVDYYNCLLKLSRTDLMHLKGDLEMTEAGLMELPDEEALLTLNRLVGEAAIVIAIASYAGDEG